VPLLKIETVNYCQYFANVELPLDVIRDAIVVPTQAVIPVQNVFISNFGKAKEIMVETATRTDASL
jgi:membrane fusion protein (multidrug efflux system)